MARVPVPAPAIAIEVKMANTEPLATRGIVDCHQAAIEPPLTPMAVKPTKVSKGTSKYAEAAAPIAPELKINTEAHLDEISISTSGVKKNNFRIALYKLTKIETLEVCIWFAIALKISMEVKCE